MKKYSLIYIVSMICFLVIAPSCTDMDEDTTGQMVSNDFYADPSLIPQAVGAAYAELQAYQNHWGVWGLQTVSSDEPVGAIYGITAGYRGPDESDRDTGQPETG